MGNPPLGDGVKHCGLLVVMGAMFRTIILLVSATSSWAWRLSSSDVSIMIGEKGRGGFCLGGGGGGSFSGDER